MVRGARAQRRDGWTVRGAAGGWGGLVRPPPLKSNSLIDRTMGVAKVNAWIDPAADMQDQTGAQLENSVW